MNKEKLFSFNTPDFPNYNLEVVSFKGYQEIGELFRYEIDLISKESDIDFDKILQSEVSLQIHEKNGEDIFIHGVLEYFEAHQQIDDFIHYKTSLVPKLWWLTLAQYQEIFLNKEVPVIIEDILIEAKIDYEFRMQGNYEKREFVCQYKESRYDFIKRWMHRDGIYFYFESDENSTKLIITNSKDTQKESSQKISYKPASGLQDFEEQVASSIIYRSNNSLQSVRMRNYNYEKPSLEINANTDTPYKSYKETYLFGNNIKSQAEAKKLSEIHAQKYKSLDKEMIGESNIRSLSVGNIFTLKDYFKKDLNGKYLMVKVESEGSQRGFLTTAFRDESDESSNYSNTFTMIPITVQFRMQKTSPWPHISGVISATIDGQGSGETAELDEQGRYKVIMPFDLSGKKDGKASAYLRMAQPSAGEKQGMHFPLHKSTEVLISFKNGDSDQPVITGAVPNKESPSPVTEDNFDDNILQTHAGNFLKMDDKEPPHIKLGIMNNNDANNYDSDNYIQINGIKKKEDEATGIELRTNGTLKMKALGDEKWRCRNSIKNYLGHKLTTTVGATEDFKLANLFGFTAGAKENIMLGLNFDLQVAGGVKFSTGKGMKILSPTTRRLESIVAAVGEGKQNWYGKVTEDYGSKLQNIDDLNTIAGVVTRTAEDITTTAEDITITTANMNIISDDMNIDALDTMIDTANMNIISDDMNIDAIGMNIDATLIVIE